LIFWLTSSIAPGKVLKYSALSGAIFISLIYVIALFLSFTVFISFGLQSYYEVMARTGYYESSWHETSLKGKNLRKYTHFWPILDFFRFTLFFLPDRFFEENKPDSKKKAKELVESEVDFGDETYPLMDSGSIPQTKKTSFMKPPLAGNRRSITPNPLIKLVQANSRRGSTSKNQSNTPRMGNLLQKNS
jgi:hypothetical protein